MCLAAGLMTRGGTYEREPVFEAFAPAVATLGSPDRLSRTEPPRRVLLRDHTVGHRPIARVARARGCGPPRAVPVLPSLPGGREAVGVRPVQTGQAAAGAGQEAGEVREPARTAEPSLPPA